MEQHNKLGQHHQMNYSFGMVALLLVALAGLFACSHSLRDTAEQDIATAPNLIFNFGLDASGAYAVNDQTLWPADTTSSRRYGIQGDVEVKKDYVTSDEPFFFWTELSEGNYRIQVTALASDANSRITIKAESRRLMIYDYPLTVGSSSFLEFVVNVRTPKIDSAESIRIKPREQKYLNWDNYLTLEFGGAKPCIKQVRITRDDEVPTVFLTGNSTVVDQENDPWASWGQMFPFFLKPEVAVANYAESGETLRSFMAAGRLDKIASVIRPGDYLFMEFAHNDQKPGWTHVEPYSTYQEELMRFVTLAREREAIPVMVTSTNRRKFDEQGNIMNTLEEYPDAMRTLASQEQITLVDLNARSKELYKALGVEGSKKAFVHYPAGTFQGQDKPLADNTHFNTYGAWQLAKCVVQEINNSDSPLKKLFKKDIKEYVPSSPDPVSSWRWPETGRSSILKPEGN